MWNDNSIIRGAAGGSAALLLALAGCASITDPIAETKRPAPAAADTLAGEPMAPVEVAQPREEIRLQPDAPLRYVVQKGDTLWAIATKFLKDAWQWPELWYVNPKVRNPHLIYPGDELYLYYVNGAPRLARAGDEPPPEAPKPAPEVLPPAGKDSLAPRIRELPLDQAIFSIPLDTIRAFLRRPRLVDKDTLDDAPYVVAFEEDALIAGAGSVAYVLDLEDRGRGQYQIVRRGQEYRDPDNNKIIGYEVLPVADAEVRAWGKPSTVFLTRSDIETRAGDYLLPMEQDPLSLRFVPHAPERPVNGRIISVYNGASKIGQYQVVAINRGTEHGIEPGHVLTVMQTSREAEDPYSFFGRDVQLPDLKAGTLMVFKTGPRVSYGLITSALRPIHLLDRVEKPEPTQ